MGIFCAPMCVISFCDSDSPEFNRWSTTFVKLLQPYSILEISNVFFFETFSVTNQEFHKMRTNSRKIIFWTILSLKYFPIIKIRVPIIKVYVIIIIIIGAIFNDCPFCLLNLILNDFCMKLTFLLYFKASMLKCSTITRPSIGLHCSQQSWKTLWSIFKHLHTCTVFIFLIILTSFFLNLDVHT